MTTLVDSIETELARITDSLLVSRIRQLLVTPTPHERDWDYGLPGQTYVCWNVLEHRASNTAIVYCESGFGPLHPWGLVALTGPGTGMGMDSSWYETLEDAVRESPACDLPAPPDL